PSSVILSHRPPTPTSTPFPYTTLFRSYLKRATGAKKVDDRVLTEYSKVAGMTKVETMADIRAIQKGTADRLGISVEELVAQIARSEEHTSELQSRFDLVCRLLLEKKKN